MLPTLGGLLIQLVDRWLATTGFPAKNFSTDGEDIVEAQKTSLKSHCKRVVKKLDLDLPWEALADQVLAARDAALGRHALWRNWTLLFKLSNGHRVSAADNRNRSES